MTSITETMSHDHKACDDKFARAEEAVGNANWESADTLYEQFEQAMEHHFNAEEEQLFPAFEQAQGSSAGPTQVMRMEHEQMRGLFASMRDALANRDGDAFLGDSETLLILMQQHNAKEEQILYPMSDRVLGEAYAEQLPIG